MAVWTATPTAAGLPCQRRLRERIQSERQVVGGLLKKAEALVASRKGVNGGAAAQAHSGACALPRLGKKGGRFLRPETPPEAAATDGAAGAEKRRKMSPIVEVEVIEPTMPKAQRERLYGLLSSLSAEMPFPAHIVDVMNSHCCCVVGVNGDELDIDLGKTKDAALFQLLNLLEEFAQQVKIQRLEEDQEPPKIEAVDASDAISRASICQPEEGEIVDEGADMDVDICGGVSSLSPPAKQQEDEFGGGASPVAVHKFPETLPCSSSSGSPSGSSCSGSSSSSSSGASSGSSSSNSGSSGSSCSGSSSSSSGSDSDSCDDDEDTASSRADTSDPPTEAAAMPLEQQQVTDDKKLKLTERAASLMATEMTDRRASPAARVGAKPLEQQQVTEHDKKLITERAASPATEMEELIARAQKQKLRRVLDRKRAREELDEMKRTARPVYDIIDPSDMKQLGISREVQYIVSPVKSRDSVHRRGGGLLQKLGFFLKAE